MALQLKDAVELAIERNAAGLAQAADSQAVNDLAPKVANDAETLHDARRNPVAYISVIVILGLVVVIVAFTYACYALLPWASASPPRELPDAIISLGSAAVGALAGLLAPSPR